MIPLFGSAACAIAPGTTAQQSSALSSPDEVTTPAAGAATEPESPAAPAESDAGAASSCEEPGRYAVNGGTVTDQGTGDTQGLVWQLVVDPTLRTQADAASYCSALTIEGEGGFRLPSSHELQSLLLKPGGIKGGPGFCLPSIDQTTFTSTPTDGFWSATDRPTTSELDAVQGFEVGFDDGRTHPADPTSTFYVRCVK